MMLQGDLFGEVWEAAPAGFALWPEFVDPAEEAALTERIDAGPLAPFRFHQWEGKRLTASYGFGYDYGRARLAEAPPIPEWIANLALRAATFAGVEEPVSQALLTRYDPGAGIGWHRDRPQFGAVLGLSLTSPVTFRLRRRTATGFERRSIVLPPRSLYRLEGPVRWEWEHSIAPVDRTRRSITLRTLRRS